jgi:hypothetical protein
MLREAGSIGGLQESVETAPIFAVRRIGGHAARFRQE